MFRTVTATVLRPGAPTLDRFGNEVTGALAEETANVLVQEPTTDEMEAARPMGATVALTLHFPKEYTSRLGGCTVVLPAPWDADGGYRVVGDPLPLMDANTPGRFNRAVHVEAAHG